MNRYTFEILHKSKSALIVTVSAQSFDLACEKAKLIVKDCGYKNNKLYIMKVEGMEIV